MADSTFIEDFVLRFVYLWMLDTTLLFLQFIVAQIICRFFKRKTVVLNYKPCYTTISNIFRMLLKEVLFIAIVVLVQRAYDSVAQWNKLSHHHYALLDLAFLQLFKIVAHPVVERLFGCRDQSSKLKLTD